LSTARQGDADRRGSGPATVDMPALLDALAARDDVFRMERQMADLTRQLEEKDEALAAARTQQREAVRLVRQLQESAHACAQQVAAVERDLGAALRREQAQAGEQRELLDRAAETALADASSMELLRRLGGRVPPARSARSA